MKRLLKLFLVALVTCCTARAAQAGEEQRPLRILATFYPVYLHTLNVIADLPGVELDLLAPPETGCLHDYQLAPSDMVKLASANVLIANGGGMEPFLEAAASQRHLHIVDASAGIPLIRDEHGTNPHVWLSLLGAMRQVRNIADQLAAIDPARAVAYRANADHYSRELARLRDRMLDELQPLRGARIITFHEAFPYFAQEFGLVVAGVIEREPGSQPGARELAEMIRTVRDSGTMAIFVEPQYDDDAARVIARETEARIYTLDPAVTGPLEKDAYLKIMQKNLDTLKSAGLTTDGH